MLLSNVIFKHPNYSYCKANITIENGLIEKIDIIDNSPDCFKFAEFYVTPGFVNSHLHPNQLFDRRLMDGINITEILHQMHAGHKKNEEDRYVQALFVLIEAIKAGATSIYAVANNPFPVIKAFKTLDIKGAVTCFYNDQWEAYGKPPIISLYDLIEEQFSIAYKEKNEKLDIHIGSSSIASASDRLLILLNILSKKFKTKVNIHISEGESSVRSCIQSRQRTPIRLLHHLGILSKDWNLIHAVNIDNEEISIVSKTGANIIHCPVSNAKTGVGIAPIKAILDAGITIALGTDACSNNNTNNILNEAYFSLLLQAALHKNAQIISLETLIRWITINGYKVLGSTQKGIIEIGAPADLLLWSLNENAFTPIPCGNFDSVLIYNAPDIKPHTILIDGKIVLEDYQLTIISEKEIREAANFRSAKINSSFAKNIEAASDIEMGVSESS